MKRLALDGGSFNPMTVAHLAKIRTLVNSGQFDLTILLPCGIRADKETTGDILPVHRAAMIDISLRGVDPNLVRVDDFDLERDAFTKNHILQTMYEKEGEVWHVIGADWVVGGATGESNIQVEWTYGRELWTGLNWVVFDRVGYPLSERDLPPKTIRMRIEEDIPEYVSSSLVRTNLLAHKPIDGLVTPEVAAYIHRHRLYLGRVPNPVTNLQLDQPRLLLDYDEHRPAALNAATALEEFVDSTNPNLIVSLGGDGQMLQTCRKYWRKRLPILGLNFGTVGYNMNKVNDLTREMFRQPLQVWQYPLLFVQADRGNGIIEESFAFNDAWVCHERRGQGLRMNLHIDDTLKLADAMGDGFLVCSPQGSTGYAMAMGASPLLGNSQALMVVGNNMSEPMGWKQALRPLDANFSISNADTSGFRPMYALVDGVDKGQVKELRIRASKFAAVELAFFPDQSPLEKLDYLQFPNQPPLFRGIK